MNRANPNRTFRAFQMRTVVLVALLLTVLVSLLPAIALADGAVSEAFSTTDTTLTTGTLLSLQQNSKTNVETATTKNENTLLGVVGNDTLLQLGGGTNQVQAVVTGRAPVLVSDINGAIKTGDSLAVSPISGVAMKATTAGSVVGVAQADLANATTTTHTIKDSKGASHTTRIGLINAQIDVAYYAPPVDKIKPLLPTLLVTIGRTIAGKDVSGIRVVVSVIVLLLGFGTVVIMLQVSIRASITAIGRNPLAHTEIRQGLIDVTVTSLAVLILILIIIYVILTV